MWYWYPLCAILRKKNQELYSIEIIYWLARKWYVKKCHLVPYIYSDLHDCYYWLIKNMISHMIHRGIILHTLCKKCYLARYAWCAYVIFLRKISSQKWIPTSLLVNDFMETVIRRWLSIQLKNYQMCHGVKDKYIDLSYR